MSWPGGEKLEIVLHHLAGPVLHLRRRHAGVDAQVAQGVVEAVYVLRKPEWGSIECAGCVKDRIAVEVATVPDGDAHLRLWLQFAVEIHYGFGLCHSMHLGIF